MLLKHLLIGHFKKVFNIDRKYKKQLKNSILTPLIFIFSHKICLKIMCFLKYPITQIKESFGTILPFPMLFSFIGTIPN